MSSYFPLMPFMLSSVLLRYLLFAVAVCRALPVNPSEPKLLAILEGYVLYDSPTIQKAIPTNRDVATRPLSSRNPCHDVNMLIIGPLGSFNIAVMCWQ